MANITRYYIKLRLIVCISLTVFETTTVHTSLFKAACSRVYSMLNLKSSNFFQKSHFWVQYLDTKMKLSKTSTIITKDQVCILTSLLQYYWPYLCIIFGSNMGFFQANFAISYLVDVVYFNERATWYRLVHSLLAEYVFEC